MFHHRQLGEVVGISAFQRSPRTTQSPEIRFSKPFFRPPRSIGFGGIIVADSSYLIFTQLGFHNLLGIVLLTVLLILLWGFSPLILRTFGRSSTPNTSSIVVDAPKGSESFFVRRSGRHEKVAVKDVLWVKASGSYVEIKTGNQRFTQSLNLKSFFCQVEHPNLCRISRSYGVNLGQIDAIEWPYLLIGKERLIVSNSYREIVLERLNILSSD